MKNSSLCSKAGPIDWLSKMALDQCSWHGYFPFSRNQLQLSYRHP